MSPYQSTFKFSAATKGAHLARSRAMWAARSAGEPPRGCAPNFASVARMRSDLSAALAAALSLATISGGVALGAISAVQAPAVNSGMPRIDRGRLDRADGA